MPKLGRRKTWKEAAIIAVKGVPIPKLEEEGCEREA